MREQSLIEFFSYARISGYASIKEHEENLCLISQISHKLGILEIIIRNRIDKVMSAGDESWLFALPSEIILDDDESKIKEHNALVSRQTFGFWVKVAECYKIHSCAFNKEFLESLDFKKYYDKNRNRIGRNPVTLHQKAYLLFLLLRTIRNRAFHFENLLKINIDGKPRLSAKLSLKDSFVIVAIEPKQIVNFLDDILKSFDENLVEYAKN